MLRESARQSARGVPLKYRLERPLTIATTHKRESRTDNSTSARRQPARRGRRLRLVAFGGGTGLPILLAGLRRRDRAIMAVVTVADDGGSSGRLRRERASRRPAGETAALTLAVAAQHETVTWTPLRRPLSARAR